jgi:hypothetical protein
MTSTATTLRMPLNNTMLASRSRTASASAARTHHFAFASSEIILIKIMCNNAEYSGIMIFSIESLVHHDADYPAKSSR